MTLRGPPGDRSPAELLTFGVVNLDKPPGPSSHQVSGWIRDAVDEKLSTLEASEPIDRRARTLDPKVTGCLPVMLGDATRLAQVFLEGKGVRCCPRVSRSGAVGRRIDRRRVRGTDLPEAAAKSAVSRRLRVRTIHDLDVLEREERRILLRIRCESGTYVRKLCHDLGLAMGTGGHMGALRRTMTEPFDDTDLHTATEFLDALAFWLEDDDPEPLYDVVDPAERILENLARVTIAESAAHEVANGAPVYAPGVLDVGSDASHGDLVACFTPAGAAVCLGELVGSREADSGVVVDLERVLV